MKKHKPLKHAHRKMLMADKKAKGTYSRKDIPKPYTCLNTSCYYTEFCWAESRKNCLLPWCNTETYSKIIYPKR